MLESALGTRLGVARVARWQFEAASIPRVACMGCLDRAELQSTFAEVKIVSTIFRQTSRTSNNDDSKKDGERTVVPNRKTPYHVVGTSTLW